MSLPAVSAREAIAAFKKCGFELARINGSHHIYKRPGHRFNLTIPFHSRRAIKRGTLRKLIRDAGLTTDEFMELLG